MLEAEAREILIKAREDVELEENWCQGKWVRGNAQCATGAIINRGRTTPNARALATQEFGGGTLFDAVDFNDAHTHAQVLARFDEAITRLTLILARNLIASEDRWCQGVAALDSKCHSTSPRGLRACSWCASGALLKVCDGVTREYDQAVEKLLGTKDDLELVKFNDDPSHTHEQILELFERAIV